MLLTRENPLTTRPSVRWRIASAAGLAIAVAFAAALAGNRPAVGQQAENAAAKEAPKRSRRMHQNQRPLMNRNQRPPKRRARMLKMSSARLSPRRPPPKRRRHWRRRGASGRSCSDTPAAEATPSISGRSGCWSKSDAPGDALCPQSLRHKPHPVLPISDWGDAATAADLQAEKAKLLDEIQALRAKLRNSACGVGLHAPSALPNGNVASPTTEIVSSPAPMKTAIWFKKLGPPTTTASRRSHRAG